jgi:hypothetical protein
MSTVRKSPKPSRVAPKKRRSPAGIKEPVDIEKLVRDPMKAPWDAVVAFIDQHGYEPKVKWGS